MRIELTSDDCCTDLVAPEPLADQARVRLVAVFRALGDPTRFDIFQFIAAQAEPICVCYVVDRFSVSQPTVSHHLKVLRDAHLVTVSRRGVWAYYAATPEGRRLVAEVGEAVRAQGVAVAN